MNSNYKIKLKKEAAKFIKKQDKTRRQQINKIIELLRKDPYQVKNIKPLKGTGEAHIYRIRFGDFRMLFQVINDELFIIIIKIGPRGDVYKK